MCHAILNFHWKTIVAVIKTKYLIIGKTEHIFYLPKIAKQIPIFSIFFSFFYLDCVDWKMYPQS